MNKKKVIKRVGVAALIGFIVAAGIGAYIWFMPKRDIQSQDVDFKTTAKALVEEYLKDNAGSNAKYLAADGESKILAVTGLVHSVVENQSGEKVILLKGNGESAGVMCTFLKETSENVKDMPIGTEISVKGVIKSGAVYDEDLEMYEDVTLIKCDLYNN